MLGSGADPGRGSQPAADIVINPAVEAAVSFHHTHSLLSQPESIAAPWPVQNILLGNVCEQLAGIMELPGVDLASRDLSVTSPTP